jgi:hypothetical protein
MLETVFAIVIAILILSNIDSLLALGVWALLAALGIAVLEVAGAGLMWLGYVPLPKVGGIVIGAIGLGLLVWLLVWVRRKRL